MINIKEEIRAAMQEQLVFSLSVDDATEVAYEFVKKYVSKAIDKTQGYYTDVEYVTGQSKLDFMSENGLKDDH